MLGGGRNKFPPAYSLKELHDVYDKFETARVSKAKEITKQTHISPDPFGKFVVTKTDICPHKIITPNTSYWLETIYMVDGEMGMSLPGKMEELPGYFFDALSIVRTAKALVRKEEEPKGK